MVEVNFDAYLPGIISTVIIMVGGALVWFSKQRATTVGGTIKLETVQGDVSDVKKDMENGFEGIRKLIEKQETENRLEYRDAVKRIEALEREGYNLRYRIGEAEKRLDRNGNGRNGGTKSAV